MEKYPSELSFLGCHLQMVIFSRSDLDRFSAALTQVEGSPEQWETPHKSLF